MSSTAAGPAPATRTPVRLRRRRVMAAAAAALLFYALFGFFVVPRLISWQIRSQARQTLGRDASVGRVAFNPFTLAATIEDLRLADRDGPDLLTIGRLRLDLELSGLFRRALRFREIAVDRPVVSARLLADGRPSIADLIESAEPGGAGTDLPRLVIDRLAVHSGVVQFSDASRQPEYRSRFEPLDLDVTNLVTLPDEGGEHSIVIGVGDGAELRWSGRQVVAPLRFEGRLEIARLPLAGLWDYAAGGHALRIREGRADVTLPYEITRTGSGFELALRAASLDIRGLAVRPRQEEVDWLTVPALRVEGVDASWPEARVSAARVSAANARLLARREQDGSLGWAGAWSSPAGAAAGSRPGPVQVRVADVNVDGAAVTFEDLSVEPGVRLELHDLAARATGVSNDLAAAVPIHLEARVQDAGAVEVSGTVAPSPLAADVQVTATAIDLATLAPYLRVVPGTEFGGGTVSMTARTTYSTAGAVTVSGDGRIENVDLRDGSGERLAAWRAMRIDALTYSSVPPAARIRRVAFEGAFARLHIDKEGRLNLTRLRAGSEPAGPAPSASTRVEIGRIDFRDGSADFADDSLILPFRAQIHAANGSIRDISSFASAPATIDIEGRVDRTGVVNVGGTLRLADPMASSEITVAFRSIEMPALTPYFAQFAGYALRRGSLDLDVRYLVTDRRLNGNHSMVARDLVLGERVRDSQGPGFAVRLAIALLKDREGRINLNVPIEGTVDDPEFGYRKVFWSAVRTILGNAAKAPFRALGRLFGRDEDDLELVEFDAGRADLLPIEQDKLTKLAEQLAARSELTLAVEGRFDPEADVQVLKRARLEAAIDARRTAAQAAAAAAGTSTLETILEALFVEQFSAEALQAQRSRFGASAPAAAVPGEAPPAAFDGAGFYESLRARLVEAQSISMPDLEALGRARAEAIQAALTGAGGIEVSRVRVAAPARVTRGKAGSSRIASELTMSAGPEDEGAAP